ncbi:MAG: hypothetical protein ABI389_15045 [Rhodanobacter sp.]
MPLRQQARDTYRLLFCPALLSVFGLVSWWSASGALNGILIGSCVGMLPSLVMGTPARMAMVDGDRAEIEAWLGKHNHLHDARGWVPKLPRALYFDSQVVQFDGNSVVGPIVTLRKLRTMLRANTLMGA